jgi:hypothetical protein
MGTPLRRNSLPPLGLPHDPMHMLLTLSSEEAVSYERGTPVAPGETFLEGSGKSKSGPDRAGIVSYFFPRWGAIVQRRQFEYTRTSVMREAQKCGYLGAQDTYCVQPISLYP